MILKFLQFCFKSLATIFSKLGANYTYTKLFRYLMKYKFISIIYKPLKYLFKHIILFIKLVTAIMAILSLFNVTILYCNFDIMNEITNYIINIINYIKNLISKWFSNEEEDEIPEPRDFLTYRKDIKIIDKTIQQTSNNSYWILPLFILGYAAIYYYNPQSNLSEIIEPILNKIDYKLPVEDPTVFITGVFTYKFITASISWITGYDLNLFKGDDPSEDIIKNNDTNSNYSPTNNLNKDTKKDYEESFIKINEKYDLEDEDTSKASTSNLPDIGEHKIPNIENPYKKVKVIPISLKESEIKIEEWE
uniref:Uncharacterized protein n=1 Tax=Butyriboletus roseoflavus TaxID=1325616 RepID=A0A8K1ZR04_9AGAM|nr:hypothetical protein [Butyriboletus roseoflavus]